MLTQSLPNTSSNLNFLVEQSVKRTSECLFVCVNPLHNSSNESDGQSPTQPTVIEDRYLLRNIMKRIYHKAWYLNSRLDVRVLLFNCLKSNPKSQNNAKQNLNYELILTDHLLKPNTNAFKEFCLSYFHTNSQQENIGIVNLTLPTDSQADSVTSSVDLQNDLIFQNKFYDYGIVAGTFDRLHVGHKILLSESAMLMQKKLLIGITTDEMNGKKTLCELIEPLDTRIGHVTQFLNTVEPSLEVEFAKLYDPFGPSITEKDCTCLVVSHETFKGGFAVNEKRKENKLNAMDVHVIDLVDEESPANSSNVVNGEEKVSSTKERLNLLGNLLRDPYVPYDTSKPYVIGLTGCLASGKSSVRKRLEGLGAVSVDCDLLGHQSYTKGSNAYHEIVKKFGDGIIDELGNINRKALGAIVFANPDKLKQLTDIVWPEIKRLLEIEIHKQFEKGNGLIFVEAALLIDAGWHENMNEIWVCYITEDESVRRSSERDKLPIEEIKKRIKSQLPNKARLEYANVVLATLWEPEYTQMQVEKAWKLLRERTVDLKITK